MPRLGLYGNECAVATLEATRGVSTQGVEVHYERPVRPEGPSVHYEEGVGRFEEAAEISPKFEIQIASLFHRGLIMAQYGASAAPEIGNLNFVPFEAM